MPRMCLRATTAFHLEAHLSAADNVCSTPTRRCALHAPHTLAHWPSFLWYLGNTPLGVQATLSHFFK